MGTKIIKVGNAWSIVPWGVSPYGYQPFDLVSGGDACYLVENFDDPADPSTGDWEIGVAPVAYVTDHYELQRSDGGASVLESSNGGALVSFSTGTVRCHNIFPAHELGFLAAANDLSDVTTVATARANLELGDVALADTGSGNGLNADTLDGYHGSQYWRRATSETITGNHVHAGDLALNGDNIFTGLNNYGTVGPPLKSGATGRFVIPAGANLWATT
jgi:hypothetical protein